MKNKEELLREEYEHGEEEASSSKKSDDTIYISYINTDNYILEQVKSAVLAVHADAKQRYSFIQYDKGLGTTSEVSSFEFEKRLYRPIDSKLLEQKVITLPTGVKEYGTTEKLIKEIEEFLYTYFEAPGYYRDLLPYIILFYWVYDKFPFIPYLHFIGRTGTGKTTAMEVVGSICYKPIDASGAVSMASIFRISSSWKGTLLLDEFNPGGEGYRDMLTLLKTGVSDRAVLRVEGEKKKEVVGFLVKSPKIFTSENPTTDAGLRSRVIEIKMEKNTKRLPLYRQLSFEKKSQELKNKLLLWRLRKLSKINLEEIEFGFDDLQAFDGRVQQVITPIYYLAGKKAKKKILGFAKEQQEETLRERRESLDGQIFTYIVENMEVEVTIKNITELLNTNKKYPLTERKIGSIIRKILGFETEKRGHDKLTCVVLEKEEKRIKELKEYYGIDTLLSPVASTARTAKVATISETKDNKEEQTASDQEIKDLFDS